VLAVDVLVIQDMGSRFSQSLSVIPTVRHKKKTGTDLWSFHCLSLFNRHLHLLWGRAQCRPSTTCFTSYQNGARPTTDLSLSFPDLWGSRLWSRGRLRLTCPKTIGQQPNPRSRPGSQRSELRGYGLSLVNRGAIAMGYPAKEKRATGTL